MRSLVLLNVASRSHSPEKNFMTDILYHSIKKKKTRKCTITGRKIRPTEWHAKLYYIIVFRAVGPQIPPEGDNTDS